MNIITYCRFCPPCSQTHTSIGGFAIQFKEVICQYHVAQLTLANMRYTDKYRYELWYELMGCE